MVLGCVNSWFLSSVCDGESALFYSVLIRRNLSFDLRWFYRHMIYHFVVGLPLFERGCSCCIRSLYLSPDKRQHNGALAVQTKEPKRSLPNPPPTLGPTKSSAWIFCLHLANYLHLSICCTNTPFGSITYSSLLCTHSLVSVFIPFVSFFIFLSFSLTILIFFTICIPIMRF